MGFCGSQKTVAPKEIDPLMDKTGARELRTNIFGQLPGKMEQGQSAVDAATAAAYRGAGAFQPVSDFANRTLSGYYFRNPLLDRGLQATRYATDRALAASRDAIMRGLAGIRSASGAEAQASQEGARAGLAGQQAAQRSNFGRAGQTFGTTNQLAQEGTSAALGANLDRENRIREAQLASNEAQQLGGMSAQEAQVRAQLAAQETQARQAQYAQERQLQQQAPGMIAQSAMLPTQLLGQIPGLQYQNLEGASNLVKNLASSQVVNPNSYYKPGVGDYALQTMGALGSMGGGM